MTVSRVLRDAPDISAATKLRVRTIAQQMGYVPDVMAQGLRTRASRLLGVLLPNVTDPAASRLLLALEERTHELGFDLLLAQSLHQADREELCLRRFLARRVEGLFIAPVYRLTPFAPVYADLRRRGTRVVVLGPRPPFCEDFVGVEGDDVAGSSFATRHLLELGHRRIACLAGPPQSPVAQAQLEGYRRALREQNLEPDDRLVFKAGVTFEDGARAASQMLAENAGATAVQACSDAVATGAAAALLAHGLRIPTDISLVGYGNLPGTEHHRVPLTTVSQPKYRLGTAAIEVMLRLLRTEPAETRRLPAELVVRSSTGPPQRQIQLWTQGNA